MKAKEERTPNKGCASGNKSLTQRVEALEKKMDAVISGLQDIMIRLGVLEYEGVQLPKAETPEPWTPLEYKGKLYARIFKGDDTLTIKPVESLHVKVRDPAIKKFLVPRVLERLRQKHGVTYYVNSQSGILTSFVVKGKLNDGQIKDLLNPIGWALEKASRREVSAHG